MTTEQRQRSGSSGRAQLPPAEEREWEHVLWEVSDEGVLAITMNRPERMNAVNHPTIRELLRLFQDVAPRPEVRVVTLRGAGTRAFSSGDEIGRMDPEPGVDNAHTGHHQLVVAIRELPKPVAALMYGHAYGAGFELALACDFRLAADNIEIGDHRVTRAIGLIAGSSWFLPQIVGRARATELMMTGRHLDATEALEWGLVNRVWPLDEFESGAADYVAMLAKLPTIATGVFKAALEYSTMHGLRDSLANETSITRRNSGTEDAAEGRRSFIERREPVYTGR